MKKSVIFIALTSFIMSACNKEQTLFVADHYVDCEGVSPQKCLLIKENKTDEWSNFYDNIEGFTYEEGYFYELKVKVSKIKNPMQDESSLKYSLIKVVSKTAAGVLNETENTMIKDFEGNWEVIEINDFVNNTGKNPYFIIANGKINGNNGCNNFGGDIKQNSDGTYTIKNMFQTKMFCVETSGLEIKFSIALQEITNFKRENNALLVFDKENKPLFKAIPKDASEMGSNIKTSETIEKQTFVSQNEKYSISYGISTRGFSKEWTYNGEKLNVHQIYPEESQKNLAVSEKDRLAIDKLFQELDLSKLETLEAPSTKHQFDGAKHASLTITSGNRTYSIPTFDHGNPPTYIKNLIEKIDKLASK
jgi:heat shock protein HslJ